MPRELLPAEVKNALIEVCGRCFWYKQPLFDMFARAGISEDMYLKYEHEPKFKIARQLLGDLEVLGDDGLLLQKRLLTVVPEDIPLAISTKHLAVITVDRARVDPEFLAHAIHSDPKILAQIGAANRGAIMSGLNLAIIKRLRVPLPPLALQQRFADLAKRVSETRAGLAAAGVDADALFDSVAQRAFRGHL
jgi:hypothetical protein